MSTRAPLQIIATGTVVAKTIREWEGKQFYSVVVCVPGEWDQYLTIGVRDDVYADIPLKCEIEANVYVGGKRKEKDGQIVENMVNLRMGKYTILSATQRPEPFEKGQGQAPAQSAAPKAQIVSDPMGLATMDPTKRAALKSAIGAEAYAKAWAAAGLEPEDDLPF